MIKFILYKWEYTRKKTGVVLKKKKIVILCIVIPVVLIIIAVTAAVAPLVISYNKNAYEKVEIVERSEEYVEPQTDPQPEEYEDMTLSADDLGRDLVEETLPNKTNDGGKAEGTTVKTTSRYNPSNSFGRSPDAISVYGKTPIYKVQQKDPDIENILVLGTDSRDVTVERGRSDSIIVLSYKKKTGKIKMVSILRDSLVPIEGHKWNRINAAYSFDGVGLAVNTVNQLFDLDIQRFVVIDFNGVRDFIDEAGGVDIVLTKAEADYYNRDNRMGIQVEAGPLHMDGNKALVYMRTRKLDSDFGRTARQRNVIQSLAKKIVREKRLTEIYGLADYAFKLVKTNISLTELTGVIASVAKQGKNLEIDSQHIPYSDAYAYKYYNGMAIISFNIDDAARRVNKFLYE